MKSKFVLKIFKFLVISILVAMIFSNAVFAAFDVTNTFTGEFGNTSNAEANKKVKATATSVQDVLVTALTAIRIAGMAIAIIMLIVVGIKIMLASPSEKANVKQYTMNYVIGAFILLSASGIVSIVQKIAFEAFKTE